MIWKKRISKTWATSLKNLQGYQTCNIHSLSLWKLMISSILTNQYASPKISISTISKTKEKILSLKNIKLKRLILWECWKKSIKMEEINILKKIKWKQKVKSNIKVLKLWMDILNIIRRDVILMDNLVMEKSQANTIVRK